MTVKIYTGDCLEVLDKLEDDSIEGGYIIKIDKPTGDGDSCSTCYDDSFSFSSRYDTNGDISDQSNIFFIYHYPKPDDISQDQKDYIQSVLANAKILSETFLCKYKKTFFGSVSGKFLKVCLAAKNLSLGSLNFSAKFHFESQG